MTRPIRVVIADDSAFIRQIIASHLSSSQLFDVVGAASDGQQAVDLVQELRPDVLTLDVDMPNMSGIEALQAIMGSTPTPVVMVSGVSLRAAEITLQAIQTGAVDFILKYVPGVKLNPEELRLDLISKVRAAAGIQVVRTLQSQTPIQTEMVKRTSVSDMEAPTTRRPVSAEIPRNSHSSVVVVGASTGGPVAIKSLLMRLPLDFDAPIIIVQHIPHPFTSVLAAQLNSQLPFRAAVAEDGETLKSRHVYLAPGDKHLLLNKQLKLELRDGPLISGHRPSIDVTMKSVSQVFHGNVFGVLLTGMGVDGASGLKFIKTQGGQTFAQESTSCVVNGMPQAAMKLEAVNHVATPEGIADRLTLEVRRARGNHLTASASHPVTTDSLLMSSIC